jgi:hypothetical protein
LLTVPEKEIEIQVPAPTEPVEVPKNEPVPA